MLKPIFVFVMVLTFYVSVGLGQSLTVNETVDYINTLLRKEAKRKWEVWQGKGHSEINYDSIILSDDGYLYKYTVTVYEVPNEVTGEPFQKGLTDNYRIHQADIALYELELSDQEITLHCTNDEKCITEYPFAMFKDGNVVLGSSPEVDKNHFTISIEAESYSVKKLFNAVSYLLNLLRESDKYERDDLYDPFRPRIIKSTKSVVGEGSTVLIPLSEKNGVYHLLIKFGNFTYNFVMDTGASTLAISSEVEAQLIKSGLISEDNYLGPGLYKLADGSIIMCRRIKIPKLVLGRFIVNDVVASVGNESSPLLLGRNVLDRFSKWSIDNNSKNLILEK